MRIAFNSDIFLLQEHGGISRYFTQLAQALAALGEEPRVFAPLHWNAYLDDLPPGLVDGRRLPTRRFGRLWPAYNRWSVKGKILRWGAEVLHETYFNGQKSTGVPTVLTIYDMIHELFPEQFSPTDATSELKKRAVEKADHVICISENTRRDLMALFGVPAAKISVIHLACDPLPPVEPNHLDPRLPERPFLLFVGHRGRYKNFRRLLEAVGSTPVLRDEFDIVAFGGGPLAPDELRTAISLGIRPGHLRQLGGDDLLLATCYRQARAFVYPSLYEGFGLPPLEAMACRCPVVASNTSSMPEVIGAAASFFDPSDTASTAEAIMAVACDEDRRSDLIAMGAARVKQFSWSRCAEETLEVYVKVANQPGREPAVAGK